jgi:hypothetical protein
VDKWDAAAVRPLLKDNGGFEEGDATAGARPGNVPDW